MIGLDSLDVQVAIKVMGWPLHPDPSSGDGQGWYLDSPEGRRQISSVPSFSTDISDAWSVVEKLTNPQGEVNEMIRRRFIDSLSLPQLMVNRELAARYICGAALSAMTAET